MSAFNASLAMSQCSGDGVSMTVVRFDHWCKIAYGMASGLARRSMSVRGITAGWEEGNGDKLRW